MSVNSHHTSNRPFKPNVMAMLSVKLLVVLYHIITITTSLQFVNVLNLGQPVYPYCRQKRSVKNCIFRILIFKPYRK